ncbi:MAG: DUF4214 domain-containing protein [Acidimicrobiales bacterium]
MNLRTIRRRALGVRWIAFGLALTAAGALTGTAVTASPDFGASGNVYDLDHESFSLEATFVGRDGVRYSQSRTRTGTINIDDRNPFRFGPFIGCFLGERDQGRVVASGDGCDLAIRFTNTSDRSLADLRLGFTSPRSEKGPDLEWAFEPFFAQLEPGESAVARLTVRFDQVVGPATNRISASGTIVDAGERFNYSAAFDYEVKSAPPTVPRSVTVSQPERSAHLTWMAPESDGGSPVTGYLVRLRVEHPDWLAGVSGATRWLYDETACNKPATDTTCVVKLDNLRGQPPGAYRIAVTALTELSPEGGYTFYTEPLTTGAPAPSVIAEATTLEELIAAPDFAPVLDAPILRFYVGYFGRDPDLAGAKYWLDVRRQGFSVDRIAGFMAGSDEFTTTYVGTSDSEYVDLIYRNVLGRDYDRAGFEYWLGLLENGTLTRPGVVRWVTAGAEFIAKYPFGSANPSI